MKLYHWLLSFAVLCGFGIPLTARDYIVSGTVDLKGKTIHLDAGSNIVFQKKAQLRNGTVIGNGSMVVKKRARDKDVFSGVILDGTWKGSISDDMFYRSSDSKADHGLISSLMKFEDVRFTRRKYYIEKWQTILMNPGNAVISGNGVTFVICSNKGGFNHTAWGNRYNTIYLFASRCTEDAAIRISGINIVDNSAIEAGWGENMDVETTVLYDYFFPGQASVVMEDMTCDGAGQLLQTYRVDENSREFVIRRCKVRTTQFAIELGNRETSHTDKVIIEDCDIYRYSNSVFVGPVSIVGSVGQVDTVIIRRNRFFEEKAGNIELEGAKFVSFENNKCENVFCYSGTRVPQEYHCLGNELILRSIRDKNFSEAFKIAGQKITISGNTFRIKEKPFPYVVVVEPGQTKRLELRDNRIIFAPASNPDSFDCLFALSSIKGEFLFWGNTFESTYANPHFRNYFPEKLVRFENPFPVNVRNFE
ncbi:MAG: hypothetical protein IJ222_06410 [Bacteroidales bacterium]|nr:hypothetical protein [Bacteroidales bacterium]